MAATEPDAGPLAITSESAARSHWENAIRPLAAAGAAEADEGASAASSPAVLDDAAPVRAEAVPDARTAAAQLAATNTAMIRGFVIAL